MKCFGNRRLNKHIKIILLDDQEIIQEVQRTTTGQELLDNVYKHLNIIETSYFGLRFIDTSGQTHWLEPGKYVINQLRGTDPATFYFGVKFYAADPCKLFEEITRYQFFLQIKKDILQGRLTVTSDLAAPLGAHAVQSELGDYDPKRHANGYISEFRFVANQSVELEEQICELHKAMIGDVPAIAELNYLEKVKWLDMYGVDLHSVLGEDKIDYFLGLTPSGIIVLRNKNKVGNYFWPRITKLTMKGKYFMIRVKNRAEEETYGFETPSKSACKHLWKCAMDHHTFFRLVQVTPTPNTNLKTFTLNSRFRDSNHSNMSSASRRRAQPQFIRTPSRRYTRRFVEGSEVENNNPQDPISPPQTQNPNPPHPNPQQGNKTTEPNWKPVPNSPKSTRSVQIASNSYNVPSPRSARSRKRSKSIESNSSCDEGSHRRSSSRGHRNSRSRKNRHSSSTARKQSDGESEVSNHSRNSSKKRYRHKSRQYEHSGSDSENQNSRRRHRHRHRSSHNDETIEWKEATMSTIQQSISNVKTLSNDNNESVSNKYNNNNNNNPAPHGNGSKHPQSQSQTGGHGHGNSHHRERDRERGHRHHSRRSSMDKKSSEIKKYINYELIDTEGMSRDQLNSLQYTSVVTSGDLSTSMKRRALVTMQQQQRTDGGRYNLPPSGSTNPNNGSLNDPSQPVTMMTNGQQQIPQPAQHSVMSTQDGTFNKKCLNKLQSSNTGDNSPPPPYSPPSNEQLHYGLPLQTTNPPQQQPEWSSSLNKKKTVGRSRANNPAVYEPSPSNNNAHSESPVKDQLENSDSGLGTDREYYRGENIMSSISYGANSNVAAPQRPTLAQYSQNQQANYWNDRSRGDAWMQQQQQLHLQQQPQYQNTGHGNIPNSNTEMPNHSEQTSEHVNNTSSRVINRSSSLEMILSPLVSSTCNRTRL